MENSIFNKDKKIDIEQTTIDAKNNDKSKKIYLNINKKSINVIGEKSEAVLKSKINDYNVTYSFSLKNFEASNQDMKNASYFVYKYKDCYGDLYTYEEIKENQKNKNYVRSQKNCERIKKCINLKQDDIDNNTAIYEIFLDIISYQKQFDDLRDKYNIDFLSNIPCKCFLFVKDYINKISKNVDSSSEYVYVEENNDIYKINTIKENKYVMKYDLKYLIITRLEIFKECKNFMYLRTLYEHGFIKDNEVDKYLELKYEDDTIDKFLSIGSNPLKYDKAGKSYYDGPNYLLEKYSDIIIISNKGKGLVVNGKYLSDMIEFNYIKNYYGMYAYTSNIILNENLGSMNNMSSLMKKILTLKYEFYDENIDDEILRENKEYVESFICDFEKVYSNTIYYKDGHYLNYYDFFITNNLKLSEIFLTLETGKFYIDNIKLFDKSMCNKNTNLNKLKKIKKTEFNEMSFRNIKDIMVKHYYYTFSYNFLLIKIDKEIINESKMDNENFLYNNYINYYNNKSHIDVIMLDDKDNDIRNLIYYSIDLSNCSYLYRLFTSKSIFLFMNETKNIKIYTSELMENITELFKYCTYDDVFGKKITNDNYMLEKVIISNVTNVFAFNNNIISDTFKFNYYFETSFNRLIIDVAGPYSKTFLEFSSYEIPETENSFNKNVININRKGWVGPSMLYFNIDNNKIDFSEYDLFGAKWYLRYNTNNVNTSTKNKESMSKLDYSSIYYYLNDLVMETIKICFNNKEISCSQLNFIGKRFNPRYSFKVDEFQVNYIFVNIDNEEYFNSSDYNKSDFYIKEKDFDEEELSYYKYNYVSYDEDFLKRLPLFYYGYYNYNLKYDYAHFITLKKIYYIYKEIKYNENLLSNKIKELKDENASDEEINNDSEVIYYKSKINSLKQKMDTEYKDVYIKERSILEFNVYKPNKIKQDIRCSSCNETFNEVIDFYETVDLAYKARIVLSEPRNGKDYNKQKIKELYEKECNEEKKIFFNGYVPSKRTIVKFDFFNVDLKEYCKKQQ